MNKNHKHSLSMNHDFKEYINISGSICSIVAVLMTFSYQLKIVSWFAIILGIVVGICIMALCVIQLTKLLETLTLTFDFSKSIFFKMLYWIITLFIAVYITVFSVWFTIGITSTFIQFVIREIIDMPDVFRL